ncbi:hypothetical protein SHKM778_03710 [Streptomyces sp. KM77-8]|uniref:Uncharacterized protein n=1 Tax=Streptomyces haneummycinicus TaxID=3074435 RepID=A0AAT9H9C1_9ACTN
MALDGSFMDHAAYETLQDWQGTHTAQGTVKITGRHAGVRIAEPAALLSGHPHDGSEEAGASDAGCRCRPWTAWRNHQCDRPRPCRPTARGRTRPPRRRERTAARTASRSRPAPAATNWCAVSARSSGTPLRWSAVSWPGWRAKDSSPPSCS